MHVMMGVAGYPEFNNPNFTTEEFLNDVKRVTFMSDHLDALLRSIRYRDHLGNIVFFRP